MATRAASQEGRRRQILDAAVRAFAQKGYHTSRVSDIAEEAGVAYGLVYHYFESKEAVLEAIFRDTWGIMLEAIRAVEETEPLAQRAAAEDGSDSPPHLAERSRSAV